MISEQAEYKCKCGRDGWIDMGELETKNRYPCQLCFYKVHKPGSAVITLLEKTEK